ERCDIEVSVLVDVLGCAEAPDAVALRGDDAAGIDQHDSEAGDAPVLTRLLDVGIQVGRKSRYQNFDTQQQQKRIHRIELSSAAARTAGCGSAVIRWTAGSCEAAR